MDGPTGQNCPAFLAGFSFSEPYFAGMKSPVLLLFAALLPAGLHAQSAQALRTLLMGNLKHLTLPIAPKTGRVTHRDTARAPGVAADRLLNSAFDTYARNFIYFD